MDFRMVDVEAVEYGAAAEGARGGWESVPSTVIRVQAPKLVLYSTMNADSNDVELRSGGDEMSLDFVDFVRRVEKHFVDTVTRNQIAWFQTKQCDVKSFKSHVKEDGELKFKGKGSLLFDEKGDPCDSMPRMSVVSIVLTVGTGWFWNNMWGLRMNIVEVKKRGQAKDPDGFLSDDEDDQPDG